MKVFLLLKQNSLVVFLRDNQQKQVLFPPEVVQHQEIVDQKAFENLLSNVFSYFAKQDTILFLSNELVFAQSAPKTKDMNIEDEEKKFIDKVPLSSVNLEKKTIQTKTAIFFLASNSHLFQTIVSIAQQHDCHIKKVVPLLLFGSILQKQSLSYDALAKASKEKDIIKKGDFLQIQKPEVSKKAIPVKQIVMLVVSLFCLFGAILVAASETGLLSFQKTTVKKITPVVSSKQTTTVTPKFSAPIASASATMNKENVKIQVLNGSGVAGQAGIIKDQLVGIGFTDIQIGNADGPISNATIVIFSKRIPKEFQESIFAELKKSFNSVDIQQLPTTDVYDVSITTGEVL